MKPRGLRTWIEVDRAALGHNYRVFRKLIPKTCKLMAVAKSNAYGHSLVDYARFMQKQGADWIGVDSIVEAVSLREAGIRKPLLILGYTLPERYSDVFKTNARPTISSFEALETAVKKSSPRKPMCFHLKVDTGMSRQGFFPDDIEKACQIIAANKGKVIFEGLYTHFAASKNPAFPRDTEMQQERFDKVVRIVRDFRFKPLIHASASASALLFPRTHYDMVRVGIGMYGLWPSREVAAAYARRIQLKPALSWKTIIGEIKDCKKGERVGYDFTERFARPTTIAIVPVGYWHGYPRSLSSIGTMVVRGKPARVLGRVSMDMTVIDVTKIAGAKVGDEVAILGEGISADTLADLAGTSNYEIVTRINPLIKRIYF